MDEVRVKVPSFQNVTLFLLYKIFNRDVINLRFCLFEDPTDFRDLRRLNIKSFVLIGPFVFATQKHKTNTLSSLIIEHKT